MEPESWGGLLKRTEETIRCGAENTPIEEWGGVPHIKKEFLDPREEIEINRNPEFQALVDSIIR